MTESFYSGKSILVSGHTGFKGGWLSLSLNALGAKVSGLSLAPEPGDKLFSILPNDLFERSWIEDLRTPKALNTAIRESRPDIIFHLAAQPIVGESYRNPIDTLTTNALGTALLLEACRAEESSAAVVVVTSDKCYRNDNSGRHFEEGDPLGGNDVYSMSKAATEMVVAAWHASFFAGTEGLGALATARAGNVIGGGDYGVDRIIPDAVRAFEQGSPLVVRRPAATRPWQHVLDSLSGYLTLGQSLLEDKGADSSVLKSYNFGPEDEAERSVEELLEAWRSSWPEAGNWNADVSPAYGEATRLSLNPAKAKRELGWRPVWDFAKTITKTAEWYRLRHQQRADDAAMLEFSRDQIKSFLGEAGN